MGRYATDTGGGDFQQAPAGSHVARCIRIVDLGTQRQEYQGTVSFKNQVLVSWELCHELYDYEDEAGNKVSKPFLVSKFYTNSLKDTSNLYKDLTNWRGREFTADELKKFDLQSILNAPCILSVVHNEKGKAKVESVIKLTKGTEAPAAVNKPYVFWLDEFERGKFDELSDGIKAIIEKSPEYQSMVKATTQELVNTLPPSHAFSDFDDSIPFQMSRYSTIGNPPSGSVADAKKEVFDAMDDEEQKFLFGIADELTLLVKESGDYAAATYLGNQRLDTDETIALFWLLRSDVRAAIKRGQKKE